MDTNYFLFFLFLLHSTRIKGFLKNNGKQLKQIKILLDTNGSGSIINFRKLVSNIWLDLEKECGSSVTYTYILCF